MVDRKAQRWCKPLSVVFKWIDNVPPNAEAIDFLDQGDGAPNARFTYRYQESMNWWPPTFDETHPPHRPAEQRRVPIQPLSEW